MTTIALLAAPAQCPGGVCGASPVARVTRYVASVSARLTARPSYPLPMPGPGPSTKPVEPPKTPNAAPAAATVPTAHRTRIVSRTRAGVGRWYLGAVLFRQFR